MIYTAYRLYKASLTSAKYAKKVFRQALVSRETATFTYNLTPQNESYLLNLTAQILKTDAALVEQYFNELKDNQKFKRSIVQNLSTSNLRKKKDKRCDFGNKLALYAIVRIMKPSVVVENGVEVGFTSVVLCEALRRNKEEGCDGKFIGIDINPAAGHLIKVDTRYDSLWEMKYADAVDCLNILDEKIDFYFSDGYRSYAYEQAEFAALANKISHKAIVITNKATFSKALLELSKQLKKTYSFFKEHPANHWYEGSGVGFMHG